MRTSPLISIALAVIILQVTSLSADAQNKDDKKFKFDKVSNDVKKEGKTLAKAGWMPLTGDMPLINQLDKGFRYKSELDDSGYPKWLMGASNSIAQTLAAAQMQATENAKLDLVKQIETEMKSVVESDVSNNQLDKEDAASVTQTISVATSSVSKKLGRVVPVFTAYRDAGKNYEVSVRLAYNYEMARKALIDEMKVILEGKTEDVRKKHEKFLDPSLRPEGTRSVSE